MGGLRTLPFLLPSLLLPLPATAGEDPLRLFATCTGRLSALMEHQWAVDGPASETTRQARDLMADLAEAATPPGSEAQAMAWRVSAKAAQAALLARATYGADAQGRAARPGRGADRRMPGADAWLKRGMGA